MKENQNDILKKIAESEYEQGFVTDLEQEVFPKGLDENVIRQISYRKEEPAWLLEFRLDAFKRWQTMKMPEWAHLTIPPIDYQDIIYFAAPRKGPENAGPGEMDPALAETFDKLGIPLHERNVLAGMAVDAIFDSVSVKTTFKETLAEKGIIFCSFQRQ